MKFNVTREQWVERFALRLARLVTGAEPASFVPVGEALWPMRGQADPEVVADEEHAARQRIAEPAGSDRFERTERIPVERLEASGEYVRDDAEWIARCVARVLQLDAFLGAEEARRSVADLAALERWRVMRPEAAAEQLYTPIKPRTE